MLITMKDLQRHINKGLMLALAFMVLSCSRPGENSTGSEYMPDMAHSIAFEANHNTYYYNNTWDTPEEYNQMAQPRKPVSGTVARGYMPYKYANLEDFRESADETYVQLQEKVSALAIADPTITNPIQPTSKEELEKVLAEGGELYNISCAVCHGEEGDGNGSIYNSGNGPYSAAPANYLKEEFLEANDARYYNAIVHGKGMMQPHTDKLSHMERWKVIHYIRSLQATSLGEEYSPIAKVNVSPVDDAEESVEE